MSRYEDMYGIQNTQATSEKAQTAVFYPHSSPWSRLWRGDAFVDGQKFDENVK